MLSAEEREGLEGLSKEDLGKLLAMIREARGMFRVGGAMPTSAFEDLVKAVPDQLVREVVADLKASRSEPGGWLPKSKERPRERGPVTEVKAILDRIWGPPIRPKPKVVTSDAEVVRDAVVRVAPSDPNYPKSEEGVVRVRRADWVTVNMKAWEEQQWLKAEDRRHRRMIDPYRMGHWDNDD